jgi:predicted glycoside hydrolase/deacetylase ChbG (UPF0249 family)
VTPLGARYLVVNADDFGMASSVNDGIAEAHRDGIVTSASLMVLRPAAAEAASRARAMPSLSVGLHVDLGEWVCHSGEWIERYRVVDVEDERAVAAQVERQLGRFRSLVGRDPTHLDSHQHAHRHEPARSVMKELADELGVPLREHSQARYEGAFYGQARHGEPYLEGISVEALCALLDDLPDGWTELGCHPGRGPVDDAYGPERALELAALCDPRVRQHLEARAITLRSFAPLREVETPRR